MNGTLKKVGAILAVLSTLVGAAAAVDRRYAKAADVERALKDIHEGLQALNVGQLQARRELLRRELFDYRNTASRLTPLEEKRVDAVREEINSLTRRIDILQRDLDERTGK